MLHTTIRLSPTVRYRLIQAGLAAAALASAAWIIPAAALPPYLALALDASLFGLAVAVGSRLECRLRQALAAAAFARWHNLPAEIEALVRDVYEDVARVSGRENPPLQRADWQALTGQSAGAAPRPAWPHLNVWARESSPPVIAVVFKKTEGMPF